VQYFGDNLGPKVKGMPLVEETSLLEDSSVTLPMVIIGKLLYFVSFSFFFLKIYLFIISML
jgi:hypothetical protein